MTTAAYTLKKTQQGDTLKLNFSVMRVKTDVSEIITSPIDVDNVAEVVLTFEGFNSNLQLGIRMKRYAKELEILLNIVCEDFEEQFLCTPEWINTAMKLKTPDSALSYQSYSGGYGHHQDIYSYNFEVYISAKPAAPITTVPIMVTNLLYEDTEFTDFQLAAPDGVVPVHKSLVTVHSDTLRTMLHSEDWKETKEGIINIKGVTVKTLQQLKRYMYLGTLPSEIEDLEFLLLIAVFYLMSRLKTECIKKLVEIVKKDDTDENMEDLVEFACQNNIPDLMKALLDI